MTTAAEQQGLREERVTVDARVWFGMRRQLLQYVVAFRIVDREAERVLAACRHADGCPAVRDRSRPCAHDCPDRETFLSALVIANNAAQYAMKGGALPYRVGQEYRPPGRETFDAIVAELEVLRAGREVLDELEQRLAAETEPPPAPPAAERPTTRLMPAPELELEGDSPSLADELELDDQENDA